MAHPSTTTATLLFSSQQPAWEDGVELTQAHQTRLFTSHSGLEQRQQSRIRSQWMMRYSAFFDASERATRDARNRAELVAPVVVPMWPEEAIVASMSTNAVTISRTATEDFFAVGDYIYLWNGTVGQFRIVSGYGISLQALTLEAATGEVVFAAGSKVWPCRLCVREGGNAEQAEDNDFTVEEDVRYMTL